MVLNRYGQRGTCVTYLFRGDCAICARSLEGQELLCVQEIVFSVLQVGALSGLMDLL